MGFNKKFLVIIIAIVIMVIMQVYVNSIEPIEFSFLGYKVHIGIFTIGILFCLKWLIKLIINSVCSFFIKLFLSNKSLGDQKTINNIAQLILVPRDEFVSKLHNLSLLEKYKNITTALIIKNNVKINYSLNKTDVKGIDIYLLNNELQELFELKKYDNALDLINNIIKKYKHEVNVIKDKILELAKYCKENDIKFKFNPKKSKYKLDKEFINNYEIEMEMIKFKMTNDNDDKLKIVEYLYKKFPLNKKTGLYLLRFLAQYKPAKYSDSKIIELVQNIFTANPDRELAYIFLNLYNQNNVFEVSQQMLLSVSNNNIEKLWFLLIMATNTKLFNIIKELIKNIIDLNSIDDNNIMHLNTFFIKNYDLLSKDDSIVKLIVSKK